MLPAVLLIGDSIRAGYQPFVAEALRGVAEVVSGADYGGTSAHIRANLDGWLRVRRYDLVHLNCGLHDLARRPATEPNVPLAEYRDNLQAILDRLAEIRVPAVWAATLPSTRGATIATSRSTAWRWTSPPTTLPRWRSHAPTGWPSTTGAAVTRAGPIISRATACEEGYRLRGCRGRRGQQVAAPGSRRPAGR